MKAGEGQGERNCSEQTGGLRRWTSTLALGVESALIGSLLDLNMAIVLAAQSPPVAKLCSLGMLMR